jgi:YidC/Oxa1 family membrane protein insertase
VDLGALWNGLLSGIFWLLLQFYLIVHDWGFAIILLTIVFRIITFPLVWKQTKSMIEMQKIQPKIKALQEKYKNNKEKQQEELMKFYKDNKVNPFGGCLPLLLQMPLLFALFQVLRSNLPDYISKVIPVAQQAAAKQWWVLIPDITKTPSEVYSIVSTAATNTVNAIGGAASAAATSTVVPGAGGMLNGVVAALPYVIMVALFALSTWLPQYLLTKDPTQRKTAGYMSIMMVWFGFISPAGVLIYWVTSSAWQIVQQVLTQRALAAKEGADA